MEKTEFNEKMGHVIAGYMTQLSKPLIGMSIEKIVHNLEQLQSVADPAMFEFLMSCYYAALEETKTNRTSDRFGSRELLEEFDNFDGD